MPVLAELLASGKKKLRDLLDYAPDQQFYGDVGTRLSDLLSAGVRDVLPTGPGQALAKQLQGKGIDVEADPAYMDKIQDIGLAGMTVYHGSPYKFDKFDMSKVGTGEGAQAYGHGLYMAENPSVAKGYTEAGVRGVDRWSTSGEPKMTISSPFWQDQTNAMLTNRSGAGLSVDQAKAQTLDWMRKNSQFAKDPETLAKAEQYLNSVKPASGNLYKADLPDEHIAKMLDWDKPLSQQPESVRKALEPLLDQTNKSFPGMKAAGMTDQMTGKDLYQAYTQHRGGNQDFASKALREAGIPGIKYLDQGSRAGGKGTSNFVVFDDQLLKIMGRE